MRKFVSILAAMGLILSPVASYAHSRDYRPHRERHEHNNTGAVILGSILGAILIETAIKDRRDDHYDGRDYYRNEYNRPTNCWKEPMRDYYGRLYYRTVCEGPEF
jgi:hypothetical protein